MRLLLRGATSLVAHAYTCRMFMFGRIRRSD